MFKVTMKNNHAIYLDEVSEMAREENRLDYATMVKWCADGAMVFLNVSPWQMAEDWEKQNDEEEEENEEEEYDEEVFQWFIIDAAAAEFFMRLTNEPIYYSYSLGMYLLGVTHFGTAWRCVMTEWKLEEE